MFFDGTEVLYENSMWFVKLENHGIKEKDILPVLLYFESSIKYKYKGKSKIYSEGDPSGGLNVGMVLT